MRILPQFGPGIVDIKAIRNFGAGLLVCACSSAFAQGLRAPDCSVLNPAACPDTNFLVDSPGFEKALERFAGHTKARYFAGIATPVAADLTQQALAGLGGPPKSTKRLSDGLFLFEACPPHDCGGQAAALIVSAKHGIEALGFSSFEQDPSGVKRRLDFYIRQNAKDAPELFSCLTKWGTGADFKRQEWQLQHGSDGGIARRTRVHYLR